MFCNSKYLTNIYQDDEWLTVHTNGGNIRWNQRSLLTGYGEVWYNPEAISNIIILNNMKKKFKVTYDSDDDRFTVHKPEKLIHFSCSN